MSRTMIMCAAAVASGLATFNLLSGFSAPEASGYSPAFAMTTAHPQSQNRGEKQQETFDGRIVDLYMHLTQQDDASENRDRNRDRDDNQNWERDRDSMQDRPMGNDRARRSADNPLGIIVKESGLLGESETLHVLLFEPHVSANQSSASQCREKIGQSVQIVGRRVERDDVTAIVVEQIRGQESRPERPNRERPTNDRNEPSRNR